MAKEVSLSDFIVSDSIDTLDSLVRRLKICQGFANIIAPEKKISIKYNSKNNNSYTSKDGPIVISNEGKSKMDLSIGLTIHEAYHKKYSDELFDAIQLIAWNTDVDSIISKLNLKDVEFKYYKPCYVSNDHLKTIINIIEDRRIDFKAWSENPGWRGYYLNLYNTYFWPKHLKSALAKPSPQTMDGYLFRLINLNNKWSDINALPGLDEIAMEFDLSTIKHTTVTDVLHKAIQIYFIIIHYVNDVTPKQTDDKKSSSGDSAGSNNSDDNSNQPSNNSDEDLTDEDSNGTSSNGSDSNDNSSVPSSFQPTDDEPIEDLDDYQVDQILQDQKHFINYAPSDLKPVTSKHAKQLRDIMKDNRELKRTSLLDSQIPVVMIENHKLDDTLPIYKNYNVNNNTESYNKGILAGKKLAKQLQIINDKRIMEFPRKKAGLISNRLLSEASYNSNIFSTRIVEESQSTYIYMTLDLSGSVRSELQNIISFCAMLGKAFLELGNIHFKLVGRYDFNHLIYNATIYDSNRHNINYLRDRLTRLEDHGMTPDSAAYDASLDDIIKSSTGKNSYFITLSDGMPNGTYMTTNGKSISMSSVYSNHIKLIRKKLKDNNITPLSYFMTDSGEFNEYSYSYDYVKAWGNDIKVLNFSNIKEIAKTLSSILIDNKVKF